MTPEPCENPPRRSIVAVWRWPRWIWGVAISLLFVCYLLSAMPVINVVARKGEISLVNQLAGTLYAPLMWGFAESKMMQDLYLWEWQVMNRLAGSPSRSFLFNPVNRKFYMDNNRGSDVLVIHRPSRPAMNSVPASGPPRR